MLSNYHLETKSSRPDGDVFHEDLAASKAPITSLVLQLSNRLLISKIKRYSREKMFVTVGDLASSSHGFIRTKFTTKEQKIIRAGLNAIVSRMKIAGLKLPSELPEGESSVSAASKSIGVVGEGESSVTVSASGPSASTSPSTSPDESTGVPYPIAVLFGGRYPPSMQETEAGRFEAEYNRIITDCGAAGDCFPLCISQAYWGMPNQLTVRKMVSEHLKAHSDFFAQFHVPSDHEGVSFVEFCELILAQGFWFTGIAVRAAAEVLNIIILVKEFSATNEYVNVDYGFGEFPDKLMNSLPVVRLLYIHDGNNNECQHYKLIKTLPEPEPIFTTRYVYVVLFFCASSPCTLSH